MPNTSNLPPYGVFPPHLEGLANADNAMADWQPDVDNQSRQQNFIAWRNEIKSTLSDAIAPSFDRTTRQWQGAANTFIDASTKLELDTMVQKLQGENSQLPKTATLCDNPEFGTKHIDQFRVEDAPSQPAGINLKDYLCSLSSKQFEQARNTIDQAYNRKLSSLFWLKREFVRPRPYQTALIFGFDNFHSEVAYSATHSAFYSGHCLEGMLFCAAVAETWMADPDSFDDDAFKALKQYAVDFGDRRVFAGVHYPSDNISSWYIALKLIPHVFANPLPVRQFVIDAVTQHSTVYQTIMQEYINHDELKLATTLLQSELNLNQSRIT